MRLAALIRRRVPWCRLSHETIHAALSAPSNSQRRSPARGDAIACMRFPRLSGAAFKQKGAANGRPFDYCKTTA
jgi:hypothetical protein